MRWFKPNLKYETTWLDKLKQMEQDLNLWHDLSG